jgi:uncharacterized protein (DUF4415 family)
MSERTTVRSLRDARRGQTDWQRVDALTEEELEAATAADPDTEELEPGWIERAELLFPAQPKERVTVRLDADVLEWFRERGSGYQTRINAVLRSYVEAKRRAGGRR